MTFLNLPFILATVMVLRGVDAACVEDNCYRAMYWNPAGAEECSSHFITTIIPPATTTTVTVTSGIGDITTITGPLITASTITPSEIIPTYIVRACYGDVSYRFESACSCIGAGPTTATVPPPVATNTVVVPSVSVPSISPPPLITPLPIDGGGKLPEPIIVGPGLEPACLAVGAGSVVVTVQVDEFFAMSLTVSGPAFCIGDPTMPPLPPLPSSQCNCASTLPSAPFSSSSSTLLAISNETSSSYTDSFSTVFRTSYTATSTGSFSNYSITRSRRATSETTLTTAEPTTSESPETSEFESSTSSRSFQPFETRNFSSTAEPSLEPSSSAEPTLAPSSTVASSSSDSSISASSSAESSGPTSFVPVGPQIYIKITGGTYAGSYLETDEPDATVTSNFKSHVTADLDSATVWTLDRETGILFQQVGDAWWGAYFTFGVRSSFSSVMLLPADDVIGWLTTPVVQREPLRCKIDYASDFLLTCGTHGWTTLMESDKCGFTVTVPLNPLLDRGCPGSQEMILQAVIIYPTEEGISK